MATAYTSLRLNAENKRLKKEAFTRYAQTLLKKGLLALAITT